MIIPAELMIDFEHVSYTVGEGDQESLRVCLKLSGSILGLPLTVVPLWNDGTALGTRISKNYIDAPTVYS